MKSKKASIIILSVFSGIYVILGLLLAIGTPYLIAGLIYILAAVISILSIIAIKKQNKILLWIGIVLGVIQILDGLSAIINTLVYGDGTLMAMFIHVIISILFFFPVRFMFKLVRAKKAAVIA